MRHLRYFPVFISFFIAEFIHLSCVTNEPVDDVDPFIGTDFFAHTFPGAAMPFGMVQLSPDTGTEGWNYSGGYQHADNSIIGFSHTHFSGTGAALLGDILLMPTIGDRIEIQPGPSADPDQGYRSRFDHKDEVASPGYYSVLLKENDIRVELTVTRRVGMHRYTFPQARNARVILDLGHIIGRHPKGHSHVRFVSNSEVEGYKSVQGGILYFVARFSKPFATYGTWDVDYKTPESRQSLYPYKTAETGENVGVFVNYCTRKNEAILVKVGLSYVGVDAARKNIDREIPGWDFEQVRLAARKTWNEYLNRVKITGGTDAQRQIFYTALYHALVAQWISNDVDGQYFGMDGKVHTANGFDFFPTFLAWDTFRSEHPLMTLIAPEHVNDMLQSIEAKCREYGWLPAQHFRNKFGQGMVGDHLVPIVVDAYMKGFRDFDAESLYEFMRKKATELPPAPLDPEIARAGLEHYLHLGFVPADRVTESVSNTLEFCYDDWCIAQMAQALGKEADRDMFLKRASYYQNIFDSETQFMRPKKLDGSWLKVCDDQPAIATEGEHSYYDCFDPLWVGRMPNRHYTESNAWQYLWFVPHDVQGLIRLLGGSQAFADRLDTFFTISPEITGPKYVGVVGTIGQYVHGNQPSHHVAYLYDYVGMPWKTQEKVRGIMDDLYRIGPGGICGNEDMGSLSSWYVFSALGFYPVCPGQGVYAIGTPLFEEADIHLDSPYKKGKFIIKAENVSAANKYIQSATLNGKVLNKPWIEHKDIVNGGNLTFVMGSEPNKNWGSDPESAPPSMSGASKAE